MEIKYAHMHTSSASNRRQIPWRRTCATQTHISPVGARTSALPPDKDEQASRSVRSRTEREMWRGRRAFSTLSTVSKWDAVVVGGGHNGLTAAAYLARSGLSVAVLERRHVIGGAAVTEELVPGFRFSRCSYLQSLLRPSIIR